MIVFLVAAVVALAFTNLILLVGMNYLRRGLESHNAMQAKQLEFNAAAVSRIIAAERHIDTHCRELQTNRVVQGAGFDALGYIVEAVDARL